jgi:MutS domain V
MSFTKKLIGFLAVFFPWLKRREVLRARWGLPGEGNAAGASCYFDLTRKLAGTAAVVDDKSWSDLEFPKIFQIIDTTLTPVGRQYLFAQLRTYEFDTEELSRRYHLYQRLQSHQRLRENIQLALKPMKVDSAAHLADLFLGPEPERVPYHGLVLPCMLLAIAAVPIAAAHLLPAWLCAIPFFVNIFIALRIDVKLKRSVEALLDCGRMLDVADRIARLLPDVMAASAAQGASEARLRKRLKSQVLGLAWLDDVRSLPLIGGFIVIADALFLLKFAIYTFSIDRFVRSRAEWLPTFQLVGAADSAIAVANFLKQHPDHCRPRVVADQVIVIDKGYHALIREPVKNSVTLEHTSALVTGSNMTGKTTFIKMVAMNIVLGHTLGVCLADQAVLPRSPVRALIHGDQSIEEGKSRYFAEAEAIRGFIAEATSGECRIFILDEPYSGTNTVERIAVARAVLGAIGASAQALVTTHDVELQHLLGENFQLFYFQEDPNVATFFDHKLHAGASTQRNAIRVLERLGYPADIITAALAVVAAREP